MQVRVEAASGRPVTPIPGGPISGPSAWYGKDLENATAWLHRLTDADLAELDDALKAVQARGLGIADMRRADFPLPTLGPKLDEWRAEVLRGRGFVLIRGIPVDRYSMEESAMLYWGVGSYFGHAVPQNAKGHMLGHVIDLGRDEYDTSARIYQTNARQTYHVDNCDIVSLLCLQKAKKGGLSSLVSGVTIFNEMTKRRPDLATALFDYFQVDRRGEIPPGRKPYYSAPIFNWYEGLLTVYFVRRYMESARRFPDVAPFTDLQIEALDLFEQLCEEFCMFMEFEPGDMQFVHNHQILHDRTEFEDYPDKKRHLLRLWLCPPDGRPLPQSYEDKYNGDIEIGNRGGMYIDGAKLHAPLDPV